MNQNAVVPAVILLLVCALVNLVRRQWLINIVALAFQHFGLFLLHMTVRPLQLAFVPLLVGLMTTLILMVTLINSGELEKPRFFQRVSTGELFRIIAGLVVIVFVTLLIPTIRREIFPASGSYILLASFGLMALSIVQMGMKSEPLYAIIGLLSFISGFWLLYASLETSALLEALFVVLNLGLGLTGAFFLVKEEETKL